MLPRLDLLDLRHCAPIGYPGAEDAQVGAGASAPDVVMGEARGFDEDQPPNAEDANAQQELLGMPGARSHVDGILNQNPLDTVVEHLDMSALRNLGRFLGTMDPPNRFLFGAGDHRAYFRSMRVNRDSMLKTDEVGGTMRAFDVLRALRDRFANLPAEYDAPQGCGSSNCHHASVPVSGFAEWHAALRAIILAIDLAGPRGLGYAGGQLPETVSVRAPKMSRVGNGLSFGAPPYDLEGTIQGRDELWLTLHAARIGIGLPVYAAFPVSVVNKSDQIVSRDYGYVTEGGWLAVDRVLNGLHKAHPGKLNLDAANRSLVAAITDLLRKVAKNDLLLFDIKLNNMVAKRDCDSNNYKVLMIDFGPLMTIESTLYVPTDACGEMPDNRTSSACTFFINGILFLNNLLKLAPDWTAWFAPLARVVVETWRNLNEKDQSFCYSLKQDGNRTKPSSPPLFVNLPKTLPNEFIDALRLTFYNMLDRYGKKELLQTADGTKYTVVSARPSRRKPSFIDRLVDMMAAEFEKAV